MTSGDDKLTDISRVLPMPSRPDEREVEEAVRTLIRWIGEDPEREGLKDTPTRVARAWRELFSGYGGDAQGLLAQTFSEVAGYSDPVLLTDIDFQSHCEHHLAPIIGRIHVGYLPAGRVVGLSKVVRLCEVFSRRLQTQEALTAQVAHALQDGLQPKGVAVCVEAKHYCMISRGIRNPNTSTLTTTFLGAYSEDTLLRREFMQRITSGATPST